MTLDYDHETHVKDLENVVDEYSDWFMQVTRRIFYPMAGAGARRS